MVTKHTPGPWTVGIHEHITGFARGEKSGWVRGPAGHIEVGVADACLIAAAPDLLEALRGLLPDAVGNHIGGPDTQARIDAARAAIAKATGSDA